MKFTENTALIFCMIFFVLIILGGYTIWRVYLRPFLRKRRFLLTRIKMAQTESEAEYWREELHDFYKNIIL